MKSNVIAFFAKIPDYGFEILDKIIIIVSSIIGFIICMCIVAPLSVISGLMYGCAKHYFKEGCE